MDWKPLGHSREGINGQICLKFGTLLAWLNPWWCFFHVLELFIFGPSGLSPGP